MHCAQVFWYSRQQYQCCADLGSAVAFRNLYFESIHSN